MLFSTVMFSSPSYAEEQTRYRTMFCENGVMFKFWKGEDGNSRVALMNQISGTYGEKDSITGSCFFEGINLSKQYEGREDGSIYQSTLDKLIFFSGFHDHCSSGKVLIYNSKYQTIVEINTWGTTDPKTHRCEFN